MLSLDARALRALPLPLQAFARRHPAGERGELVQELFLQLLEADSAAADFSKIYSKARSRVRRFTQDIAHFSVALDEELVADADAPVFSAKRKGDATKNIAEKAGITLRAAQLRVARQRARAAGQGDLFGAGGGGV